MRTSIHTLRQPRPSAQPPLLLHSRRRFLQSLAGLGLAVVAEKTYAALKQTARQNRSALAHRYSAVPPIPTPPAADTETIRAIATVLAFKSALKVIYRAEGTFYPDTPDWNPYRVCYGDRPSQGGSPTINNWDDHWFRNRAGIPIGQGWVTTAAGASQATLDTWDDMRGQYPDAFHQDLPKFHPINQDAFTLVLMAHQGATDALQSGIEIPGQYGPFSVRESYARDWIHRCAQRWASFPKSDGSGIGDQWDQPKHRTALLLAWYAGELQLAAGYGNYFPIAKWADWDGSKWSPSGFYSYAEADAIKTSDYGFRTHPTTGKGQFHEGVDYSPDSESDQNNIAIATESCTVSAASRGDNGGYGNLVCLVPFSDPSKTLYYAHLKEIFVDEGAILPPATPIGIVGSTGRSTGRHLHFQIESSLNPVAPYAYLNSYRNPPDYSVL